MKKNSPITKRGKKFHGTEREKENGRKRGREKTNIQNPGGIFTPAPRDSIEYIR